MSKAVGVLAYVEKTRAVLRDSAVYDRQGEREEEMFICDRTCCTRVTRVGTFTSFFVSLEE